MRRWVAAVLCVASVLPGSAIGQVFHWVDDEGIIHYSSGLESVPERHRASARPLYASPREPAPLSPEPAGVEPAVTSIPFTPGSQVLVSATINGLGPITLVLDTGADRTLVAPAALARLGIPAAPSGRAWLRGVAGNAQADVVWVLSLQVGQAAAGPLAIIAHDAGLGQADGLLGRDFLDRFKVTIDGEAGVVTLGPAGP